MLITQQLINALNVGSEYALIALGYTMVYGVLRLINFAHGDVFMVGAFVGAFTARALAGGALAGGHMQLSQTLWQAGVGMLVAMVVCGILGWAIERFAYRPLRNAPRLSSLITAIGVSLFLEYMAEISWRIGGLRYFGSTPTYFPPIAGSTHGVHVIDHVLHARVIYKDVITFGVCAVTFVLLWWIVRHTRMGRAMRAVSISFDASRLMGINLNRVISFTFILGSVLAAVGGCLVGLRNNQAQPLMGVMPGLKAFIAAVIGGIGNIPGAVVGAFLLALVETLVASITIHGVSLSPYRDAVAFLILILMLLVRPEGIFGKAVPEKV